MKLDPTDIAVAIASRATAKVRAKILRLVPLARKDPREFVNRVTALLRQSYPDLISAGRDAQMLANLIAQKQSIRYLRPFPHDIGDESPLPEDHFASKMPIIEKAARWLRSRTDLSPTDIRRIDQDAQRVSYEIANHAIDDTTARIRDALANDVEHGGTLQSFRKSIEDVIDRSGLSKHATENIYRTHVARAYSAGQVEILRDKGISSSFPYCIYNATHDGRVRPEHLRMETLGLDGTAVYRTDDPVIRKFWPPWSFNCILPGTKVEGEFLAGTKSYYSGKVVEIVTKSGSKIRVTENHPVLTENGWVLAGAIKNGFKLARHMRHREMSLDNIPKFINPATRPSKIYNEPVPIDKVFDTISSANLHELFPGARGNFYGDGHSMNGDVNVVWSDRRLLRNRVPKFSDLIGNLIFKMPFLRLVCPNGLLGSPLFSESAPLETFRFGLTSHLDAHLLKSDGKWPSSISSLLAQLKQRLTSDVSGCDISNVINSDSFAITSIDKSGSFFHSPQRNTTSGEKVLDRSYAQPVLQANVEHGFAGKIVSDNLFGVRKVGAGCLEMASDRDASFDELGLDSCGVNADFSRQLIDRTSGLIAFDEVVEIRNYNWCGHVYDLQSTTGVIVSESLILSNCRCIVTLIDKETAAEYGVKEAIRWVRTGRPPEFPEHVQHPPFDLPPGWKSVAM